MYMGIHFYQSPVAHLSEFPLIAPICHLELLDGSKLTGNLSRRSNLSFVACSAAEVVRLGSIINALFLIWCTHEVVCHYSRASLSDLDGCKYFLTN